MRPAIEEALRRLDEVAGERADVEERLQQAREDVHELLSEDGLVYAASGERTMSDADIRSLYWEHPLVNVSAIGAAIGVHAGAVHKLAGKSYIRDCRVCATPFEVAHGSRTSERGARSPTSGLCPEHWAIEREEIERDWAEQRARSAAERQRRIDALRAGDYWINDDGEAIRRQDQPSPPGELHRYGTCTGSYGLDDGEHAWARGGSVRWTCLDCGDVVNEVFVRYVPPVEPDVPF